MPEDEQEDKKVTAYINGPLHKEMLERIEKTGQKQRWFVETGIRLALDVKINVK